MNFFIAFFLVLILLVGGRIENTSPEDMESVSVEIETESMELESTDKEADLLEDEKTWEWLEISADDKEGFLQQQGFSADDIFYKYKWTDGSDFYLTLYYDDEKRTGCGFVTSTYDNNTSINGFAFKECIDIDSTQVSPFSVYSYNSLLGNELQFVDIEEYPSRFEEGNYRFYYEGERLMHIYMYLTHGCDERFYIYEGESNVPQFCLELDPGWGVIFYWFT